MDVRSPFSWRAGQGLGSVFGSPCFSPLPNSFSFLPLCGLPLLPCGLYSALTIMGRSMHLRPKEIGKLHALAAKGASSTEIRVVIQAMRNRLPGKPNAPRVKNIRIAMHGGAYKKARKETRGRKKALRPRRSRSAGCREPRVRLLEGKENRPSTSPTRTLPAPVAEQPGFVPETDAPRSSLYRALVFFATLPRNW